MGLWFYAIGFRYHSLSFLERQASGASHLFPDVSSLLLLKRQAFGAMPLVSDIGSLLFLERQASGASH